MNIFLNKLALNQGIVPLSYTIQTAFVSVIIINSYLLFSKKWQGINLSKKIHANLIGMGFFVGIAYILGTYGLLYSTSINYGFLIKSTLVFIILLAWVFLKERLTKEKLLLLFLFVIGAYLISTAGKALVPQLGDLLILGSAFCFSCAIVIAKPLTKHVKPEILGGYRLTISFIFLIPLIPIFGLDTFIVKEALNVLIVGISIAVLAIYINKTISVSSASYLTMMSMMVPVIVAILGYTFLHEPVNLAQFIGGILIILSGILVHKYHI